jgi:hypothetical protein
MLHTELAATVSSGDRSASATTESDSEPPAKRLKSLFDHYSNDSSETDSHQHERQLNKYIDVISVRGHDKLIVDVIGSAEYVLLNKMFEKILCAPASSAPVERIFSQSGLILRPNRAKMSDSMLENLMFLKCNNNL